GQARRNARPRRRPVEGIGVSAMPQSVAREDPWARYVPDAAEPWDRRRVVHLHRRAGFAARWDATERDLRDGPDASIARVLEGKARTACPADFERTSKLLAESAIATNDITRLKAWWMYRLLATPDPLGERLTLVWHNPFATSNAKVQ